MSSGRSSVLVRIASQNVILLITSDVLYNLLLNLICVFNYSRKWSNFMEWIFVCIQCFLPMYKSTQPSGSLSGSRFHVSATALLVG